MQRWKKEQKKKDEKRDRQSDPMKSPQRRTSSPLVECAAIEQHSRVVEEEERVITIETKETVSRKGGGCHNVTRGLFMVKQAPKKWLRPSKFSDSLLFADSEGFDEEIRSRSRGPSRCVSLA
ncbi:hypothetical protein OUZ56_002868 [Daphnia magna]|uniref:Uncharacterized protein n=1 Tax=Daphnia magna TaxID=35525 RepID=A0ABR0A707_9CRUS|nr:hypothetical protein OUZ56_002868 [Daphnia magna]